MQETKMLEALSFDIHVPCIVQWWMFWYSAPPSLNNDLLNDGVILEIYNKAITTAIKTSFTFLFSRGHPLEVALEAVKDSLQNMSPAIAPLRHGSRNSACSCVEPWGHSRDVLRGSPAGCLKQDGDTHPPPTDRPLSCRISPSTQCSRPLA